MLAGNHYYDNRSIQHMRMGHSCQIIHIFDVVDSIGLIYYQIM